MTLWIGWVVAGVVAAVAAALGLELARTRKAGKTLSQMASDLANQALIARQEQARQIVNEALRLRKQRLDLAEADAERVARDVDDSADILGRPRE